MLHVSEFRVCFRIDRRARHLFIFNSRRAPDVRDCKYFLYGVSSLSARTIYTIELV